MHRPRDEPPRPSNIWLVMLLFTVLFWSAVIVAIVKLWPWG